MNPGSIENDKTRSGNIWGTRTVQEGTHGLRKKGMRTNYGYRYSNGIYVECIHHIRQIRYFELDGD